jgi:threonine aldolase
VKTIDLRSDTVTVPTAAMRRAMAEAAVGDDVYGEDPTATALEKRAAALLGKPAAIFTPSGTMANQASLRALTQPGDVVLAGHGAHLRHFEGGAAAALSGLQVEAIGAGGFFDGADLLAALTPGDAHFAPVRAVACENTHNTSGGRIFPLDLIRDIARAARAQGLALHLDGARLFNAVVATGIPAAVWAEPFDTVSFCLSKGLGAPVGSLVCGDGDVIRRVHRARKQLGGGMRQIGMLAAAGLYALDHHIERLAEDHANARRLATGLRALEVDVEDEPETNMVMFRIPDPGGFHRELERRGVRLGAPRGGRFRAVTHLDVGSAEIDDAIAAIREVLAALRSRAPRA